MTIRILYHQEPQGWWAESPDIDGWSVAGETYDEVRRLAEDGVSFALAARPRIAARCSTRSGSPAVSSSTTCPRPPDESRVLDAAALAGATTPRVDRRLTRHARAETRQMDAFARSRNGRYLRSPATSRIAIVREADAATTVATECSDS